MAESKSPAADREPSPGPNDGPAGLDVHVNSPHSPPHPAPVDGDLPSPQQSPPVPAQSPSPNSQSEGSPAQPKPERSPPPLLPHPEDHVAPSQHVGDASEAHLGPSGPEIELKEPPPPQDASNAPKNPTSSPHSPPVKPQAPAILLNAIPKHENEKKLGAADDDVDDETFWQKHKYDVIGAIVAVVFAMVIALFPTSLLLSKDEWTGLSTSTFTFACYNLTGPVDAAGLVSLAVSVSQCAGSAIANYTVTNPESLQIAYTTYTVSYVMLNFDSTAYSSNTWRDNVKTALTAGKFASFSVVAFGEGSEVPVEICNTNSYGVACATCQTCSSGLECDDGAFGTGNCKCPAVFVTGEAAGLPAGSAYGRCLAMSAASIVTDIVDLGTTLNYTLFATNIGTTNETFLSSSITAAVGASFSDTAIFSLSNMPWWPVQIGPGGTLSAILSISPKLLGTFSATFMWYVSDNSAVAYTDAVGTVALKSQVGLPDDPAPRTSTPWVNGGSGPAAGSTVTIYRISCGSRVSVTDSSGLFWDRDNLWNGGYRINNAAGSGLMATSRGFPVGGTYNLPILLTADSASTVAITLYFADLQSTMTGQRVFSVMLNGQATSITNLDVFATVGSGAWYTVTLPSIPASTGWMNLSFVVVTGVPFVTAISVTETIGAGVSISVGNPASSTQINYMAALHMNFLFYQSQHSGAFPSGSRRLAWRSDSCLDAIGNYGEDLTGGYYEAGNYMKFNFPTAWVLTQLAWDLLFYKNGHTYAGEYQYALDTIKWGTDYLLNSWVNDTVFVLSVGQARGKGDFIYFGPPEDYRTYVPQRPPWYITTNATQRSSETLGEAAAALAAASLVFASVNATYTAQLLAGAEAYYNFAVTYQGTFMNGVDLGYIEISELYPSSSYIDELAWGASWLYYATGNEDYLTQARGYYDTYVPNTNGGWAYSWDDKGPGLHVLLSLIDPDLTRKAIYDSYAEAYLNQWLPGTSRTVPHTPLGFAYRQEWGSTRYAANTAFLCFAYAHILEIRGMNTDYLASLLTYGQSQVDYMLGKHGYSSMVGMGDAYPRYVWHKSSYNSILYWPLMGSPWLTQSLDFRNSSRPQIHTPYGALVGGPISVGGVPSDIFVHVRSSWVYTEVTIDYNAAFAGAIAAMVEQTQGTASQGSPITDSELDLGWNFVPP